MVVISGKKGGRDEILQPGYTGDNIGEPADGQKITGYDNPVIFKKALLEEQSIGVSSNPSTQKALNKLSGNDQLPVVSYSRDPVSVWKNPNYWVYTFPSLYSRGWGMPNSGGFPRYFIEEVRRSCNAI